MDEYRAMWTRVRSCMLLDLMGQSVLMDHCGCVSLVMLGAYATLSIVNCLCDTRIRVVTAVLSTPLLPLLYIIRQNIMTSLEVNAMLASREDLLERRGAAETDSAPMSLPQALCGYTVSTRCS